ncbi:hypothetical protein U879_08525 [Defluviimonas sp. 20V17]|uniref:hypothetical protein n=1 Tax=Allgaiera indica TaxID=765699 RepID=UPI00045A56AE|nr:hypothetical protein [Allgaiera indica]KDB04090.1 hypothetical protein U879_08525 [Defluviimonas sp. 20V17]
MNGRTGWSAWLGIALVGALLLLVLTPVPGVADVHTPCAAATPAHCDAMPALAKSSPSYAPKAGFACAADAVGCHVADCTGAFFTLSGTAAVSAPTASLAVEHALLRRDIVGTAPSFDPPPPRFLA